MNTHVLSISYGRHLFIEGDPERERMCVCSDALASHHMIIFSDKSHGLSGDRVSDTLTLHPTNSFFHIGKIIDATLLGVRIVRASSKGTQWCISAQDSLGAGVVGYLLRWIIRHPLLIQEHGDIFGGDYWRQESRGNALWYYVARFLVRRADRVRAVSKRVHEHLQDLGVPASRIVTLPVYTDIPALQEIAVTTDLRALYPDASCIVLSVARFVPQKNLLLLVRAFKKLHTENQKARLVLVGRGSEEKNIREEIATCGLVGSVTIMPWTKDIVSLMKTADIYALSSNYEGWARVLVEAMACGLPIVTTAVGCAGEVCKDGVHGSVVPVGDENVFADALISLAGDADRRRTYSHAGKTDAPTIFSNQDAYVRTWALIHKWEL